jgi:hypothetical protein
MHGEDSASESELSDMDEEELSELKDDLVQG